MKNAESLTADVTLDLSGLTCPAPLLGAKQVLDDLKPGQVLALMSDCPGTKDDLFIWARHTDHEIVQVDERRAPHCVFYIRKGKRQAPKAQVALDMRGVACPGPIIEAKRLLDDMKSGEVLKLVSTCPAARDEVHAWTRSTKYKLEDERDVEAGVVEFYIRRG